MNAINENILKLFEKIVKDECKVRLYVESVTLNDLLILMELNDDEDFFNIVEHLHQFDIDVRFSSTEEPLFGRYQKIKSRVGLMRQLKIEAKTINSIMNMKPKLTKMIEISESVINQYRKED